MADMSVQPYWELTFGKDGRVEPGERDTLLRGVAEENLTDLVIFAHGWNNTRATATALYRRFFTPFPVLLDTLTAPGDRPRVGYVGVIWPSLRFADEAPPFLAVPSAGAPQPGLPPGTREALALAFPGREAVIGRLAELAERQPEDRARLEEFTGLVRTLVSPRPREADREADRNGGDDAWARDTESEPTVPAMFADSAVEVCGQFAAALEATGAEPAPGLFGGALGRVWRGALELLRQGTYWEMKRRAGVVGREGLGPVAGELAGRGPRVHLVGHSFGARLVAFALGGLPDGVRIRSLTLLQGAFSHYAFAPRLPFAPRRGGVLHGLTDRVEGPLICCHSGHDSALGTLYPLASRLAGDADSLLGVDLTRWGALGYQGIRDVPGCSARTLAEALADGLPAEGCVNVDASEVVRTGGPPSGAHSDICHEELARVVLRAGLGMR
ncbi:serine-threonine protein kinase [Streptomyces huiliensis]|uniref:serine-threonine protein kinase n=1 Tax=Streptomyces huiliensis TaxID=2876027 RepID=UPI001CBD4E59|nr:serine-threonine protein kinase [Streptomyces huiliensis]MBZ4322642.1 serine-threonine protein kinase [Streptomyces huiliensis]